MRISFLILMTMVVTLSNKAAQPVGHENASLTVIKCIDFSVSGDGKSRVWDKAQWHQLSKLDSGGEDYRSQFKIMYSPKGIYLLFEGSDNTITTRFDKDFDNLYEGDVFEAFFHPDPKIPLYFEYEINQLNKELVLIVPNIKGKIQGWIPWHYEKERVVVKRVNIEGGKVAMGDPIKSWSAELFFPYILFAPLSNVPPVSGTIWNANFYRLDYDSGKMIKWAWAPVNTSFHEYKKYRQIRFE